MTFLGLTMIHMKTDAEILLKVIKEFKSDPLLAPIASVIQVDANNGVVTLSGQVESFLLKNAAEEAALRVEEVAVVTM
jgi:osmotically-inducible protein OsmY